MQPRQPRFPRRTFLGASGAAVAAFTLVPRRVLGQGETTPSEQVPTAIIGCGSQSPQSFKNAGPGLRLMAKCDVKYVGLEDGKMIYSDFRRLLDRNDIEAVVIATPPHWHAQISIAAMASGKDVYCEKPMTRFIAEGRAVAEASQRYGRIFQIGTHGRFKEPGSFGYARAMFRRKLWTSGLVGQNDCVFIRNDRPFSALNWRGNVVFRVGTPPKNLDWDMYCGPRPPRPYQGGRFGGTHRGYWDYEGGGLGDFGQHYLGGFAWQYNRDHTAPVEVEACALPAHPQVAGPWAWIEMRYADGYTLVLDGKEWGPRYDRKEEKDITPEDLAPAQREKLDALPDPKPLVHFHEAIRTREQAGGHAEAAHRTATLLHLGNIAIRTGRKIRFDPEAEEIISVILAARRPRHMSARRPCRG